MQFKKWLILNEAGFADEGADWFFGNYLLPSDAFDWQYARPFPQDFFLMQRRWKKDRDQGRKFMNMDLEGVLNSKYISVDSAQLPDDKRWEHKPDGGPVLNIDFDAKMGRVLQSDGKKWVGYKVLDMKSELDRLFGKFEPKYYEIPKNFDEPWVR